ncbi:hypothetical protein [Streptomyces johnsoniae]|uniref:Uncharacterized protein n=1 Tax=Streptomyces johnsoniae TaxID=3075532 RepID=A0ABU2SCS2_9ACTN|nr:hypothetical protein [Streptomyces sp. DSM 41886]MDT0446755.1 hypothetical protein [Streptomyces sp. DSM 41886]
MNWAGHWRGYGPWVGSRDTYGKEHFRRPGLLPHDEQSRAFLAQAIPPMMTGHWLLRREETAAERTWTDADLAVRWLNKLYVEYPPFSRDDGKRAYTDLKTKLDYARDALPRGVDVAWVHYNRLSNLVSFSVVCCPNHFHPGIPCPRPLH